MCMLAHEEPLTKFSACLHPVPPTSQGSGTWWWEPQGTLCMHLTPLPPPNYTTGRQVHLRAKQTVSKTLANTFTHLKIPSYLSYQVQLCFLPHPNATPLALKTQLRAKLWVRAHLHSSPWLLPPPFGHISVFPLLSLSTANPRTQNWTASFLLPLPFSQPPPPALLSLLIAAAS